MAHCTVGPRQIKIAPGYDTILHKQLQFVKGKVTLKTHLFGEIQVTVG